MMITDLTFLTQTSNVLKLALMPTQISHIARLWASTELFCNQKHTANLLLIATCLKHAHHLGQTSSFSQKAADSEILVQVYWMVDTV
jgi:hypothetical protein